MKTSSGWLAISFIILMAGCTSTQPDHPGTWGSTQVNVTIAEGATAIQFLTSGGCYGSYGSIGQSIPNGTFALAGTYTQLTGVFPGRIDYPAQFTGALAGRHLTLTISIPALQRVLGPYELVSGQGRTWPACLYP